MRVSISLRLFFSAISFIIPIILLAYFVVDGIQSNIQFARSEKYGNMVSRPLINVLYSASKHKLLYVENSLKLNASEKDFASLSANIEKNLADLESLVNEYGTELKLTDQLLAEQKKESLSISKLISDWKLLYTDSQKEWGIDTQEASPALLAKYDSFILSLRLIISHVADKSNLILDPDLDSYYLMEASIVFAPDIIDWIHSKQSFLNQSLLSANPNAAAIQDMVSATQYYLNEYFGKRIEGDIDTVFSEDPNFYGSLPTLSSITEPFEQYKKSREKLLKFIKSVQPGQAVNIESLDSTFDEYSLSTYNLWDVAQKNMDGLLNARIKDMQDHMYKLGFFGLLSAIFSTVIYTLVLRSVTIPIRTMEHAMDSLAHGKLDTVIPYIENKDEIGDMARALNSFKETSIKAEEMRSEQIYEAQLKQKRNQKIEELIKVFESKSSMALSMVSSAAVQMFRSSETMVSSAEHTTNKTQSASNAMEETSSNVKAVAAAAEELSAAINEISSQVHKSAEVSSTAVQKTQDADGIVKALADSANKIGEVVKMIGDIASQINLLALNATIESARAGEAGKGFAVVASEVKNLASETSKATEEISLQISGVQKVSSEVVHALNEIRDTIFQMSSISTMIASAVEEQGAATQEIARNILNASTGVEQVSAILDQVKGYSKTTDTDARHVKSAADLFSQQSEGLKVEVEGFLGGIKAA